jgi:hypothetical protein
MGYRRLWYIERGLRGGIGGVVLTTVSVSILAAVTDAFQRSLATANHFHIAIMASLAFNSDNLHFCQISVPQWEPFVLKISVQAVIIVFGISVYLRVRPLL